MITNSNNHHRETDMAYDIDLKAGYFDTDDMGVIERAIYDLHSMTTGLYNPYGIFTGAYSAQQRISEVSDDDMEDIYTEEDIAGLYDIICPALREIRTLLHGKVTGPDKLKACPGAIAVAKKALNALGFDGYA